MTTSTSVAKEYQQAVLRTCAIREKAPQLLLAAMGMADELGEISVPLRQYVQNVVSQNAATQYRLLKEEMGDWIWYAALACQALGGNLQSLVENSFTQWMRRNLIMPDTREAFSSGVLLDVLEPVSTFLGIMKKVQFQGHPMPDRKLEILLADAVYRFDYMCSLINVELSDIMAMNQEKLEQRSLARPSQ